MIINTGTPRSVAGHAVSGALFALILGVSKSLEKGDLDGEMALGAKNGEFLLKNGENSQGVAFENKAFEKGARSGAKGAVAAFKNNAAGFEKGAKFGKNSQNSSREFSPKNCKKSSAKALIKASLEGAIIAASGIAAANALGDEDKSPLNNALSALFCVGAGVAGLYALNQLLKCEKFTLLNEQTSGKVLKNRALRKTKESK